MSFEKRQQQTFLLGMPFPLTAGAEPNGKTVVAPVRLYQDWLDRDAKDAFAARSTLSFGIQTLGATVIETSLPGTPTAKYFSWLGQAQYVRRICEDWEILLRSTSSSPTVRSSKWSRSRLAGLARCAVTAPI